MEQNLNWDILYDSRNQPSWQDISDYIANPLWEEINDYLQSAYGVAPALAYSSCATQRGWNVKYHKSSRALATLYPESGFFIALVVVGNKEEAAVRELLPGLHPRIRQLYQSSRPMTMGRWLMIKVDDKKIAEDVKRLIAIRVKPKTARGRVVQ